MSRNNRSIFLLFFLAVNKEVRTAIFTKTSNGRNFILKLALTILVAVLMEALGSATSWMHFSDKVPQVADRVHVHVLGKMHLFASRLI